MQTHSFSLITRHSELDINQHINNTNYLRYLEEARVSMLRERGLEIKEVHESPVDMILYKYNCFFKKQVYYNEELEVFSTQIQTKFVRGILRQEIYRKEDRSLVFAADAYWAFVARDKKHIHLANEYAKKFGSETNPSIQPYEIEELPSLEAAKPKKFHTTQAVARPYEMDAFFHMNNAVYSAYYELARWNFVKDTFGLNLYRNSNANSVIYRSLIEFIYPVVGFDELLIHTWVHELTKTRIIYLHEMTDSSNKVRSRAKSEICFLHPVKGIPVKIPENIFKAYSNFVA